VNAASKVLIRVFIIEPTQMACELLSHALERSRYGLRVVGMATSMDNGDLDKIATADVAIVSSTLQEGPLTGFTLLRRLVKGHGTVRFVMLLDHADRDLVIEAFRSGALGVCERSQPYNMLCKCVYSVQHGQIWANSQQLRYVLEALVTGVPSRVTNVRGEFLLTQREEAIVSLVAEGLKNREIAEALKVSEHTVKNHLFRVFEKLGISNRAELILYLLGNKGSTS
jgi:DNA-binding NarL/FixJ family response regulator